MRDASVPDFTITTNDSDRNVNTQCSVGFYEAVAKPAISSLSTGFRHQVHGVCILCTVFRKTQNQGSAIPGLLLRFELSGDNVNPCPAPMSLHLHSSQRKLQIQGGATMPDHSKVPVWFVNNVLKIMFDEQAKAKEYAFDNINKAVTNTGTTKKQAKNLSQNQSACSHCMKKFAPNAKPILCPRCNKYKHSGKCLPCPTAGPIPKELEPPSCQFPSANLHLP